MLDVYPDINTVTRALCVHGWIHRKQTDGRIATKTADRQEVEKLTASKPLTIKHSYLGGVPGFRFVHTPAGYTSYGLIYRGRRQTDYPGQHQDAEAW